MELTLLAISRPFGAWVLMSALASLACLTHRWKWEVPANLPIGFCDDSPDIRGHTIPANPTIERIGHAETLFINLREE